MADALHGGMATSAFPTSPSSLASAKNATRWKPKPGRDPQIEHIPVKASETILKYDPLNRTAVNAGYERILNPAGTATTATLTGDITDATAPLYMALHNNTSSASIDLGSRIKALSLDDIWLLARLYAASLSDAEIQDIVVGSWRYEASTLYEFGIYEVDASSANYFLIVDVANQDNDDGCVRVREPYLGSGVGDDAGLVWIDFEVSNLA